MIFLIESLMKLNCPNIGAPTSEIHEILDRILNELDVSGPWVVWAFKSVIIHGVLNEIELSGPSGVRGPKINDCVNRHLYEIELFGPKGVRCPKSMIYHRILNEVELSRLISARGPKSMSSETSQELLGAPDNS